MKLAQWHSKEWVSEGYLYFCCFIPDNRNQFYDGMFARRGFEVGYLMAALVTMGLTLLLRNHPLYLIVLAVLCTPAANLPEIMLAEWYVIPDYFLGIFLALVVLMIGLQSSGNC